MDEWVDGIGYIYPGGSQVLHWMELVGLRTLFIGSWEHSNRIILIHMMTYVTLTFLIELPIVGVS